MTDRDPNPEAPNAEPSRPAAAKAAFKALNQSHWRAVEMLMEGLREGRSIMVLTGEPCAGAPAVVREMISCLPRRMHAVESGRRAATLEEVSQPLYAALCVSEDAFDEEERPTERVRTALERLACEDRGVVYAVDSEEPLTEDALVYLARLAAGGRRLTRERQAAREAADAPLKGPVGAQILLCAPPEALPALIGLGDSALRRAAEAPIEIYPFDGPALRAAFRQHTGSVLAPDAVEIALEATGGDPALVEALFAGEVMRRATAEAQSGVDASEVSAESVAEALAELGLERPARPSGEGRRVETDFAALEIEDAARETAEDHAVEAAEDAEDDEAGPAGIGAEAPRAAEDACAGERTDPAAEDGASLGAFEEAEALQSSLEEPDEDGAPSRPDAIKKKEERSGLLGIPHFSDNTLDALDEALIDAILEEDLSGASALQDAHAAPTPAAARPAAQAHGFEEASNPEPDADPSGGEEAKPVVDKPAELSDEECRAFDEAALLGALDAAEASLSPEAMDAAGEDREAAEAGVASGVLAALGVRRRPSAAERLRLGSRPPARTLGATRRHTMVAATLGAAALTAGAILHLGAAFDDSARSRIAEAGGASRIETADAMAAETGMDAVLVGEVEHRKAAVSTHAVWSGIVNGTLSAAEYMVRGAAEQMSPNRETSDGLNRFADDLYAAREDLSHGRLESELAALAPEDALMRREGRIADALRRAEDHAAAGRYTGPVDENAYAALLEIYPLAPRDPRVRGALAALVEHYDREAVRALDAERYEVFHNYNRIADRIRARLPI